MKRIKEYIVDLLLCILMVVITVLALHIVIKTYKVSVDTPSKTQTVN